MWKSLNPKNAKKKCILILKSISYVLKNINKNTKSFTILGPNSHGVITNNIWLIEKRLAIKVL